MSNTLGPWDTGFVGLGESSRSNQEPIGSSLSRIARVRGLSAMSKNLHDSARATSRTESVREEEGRKPEDEEEEAPLCGEYVGRGEVASVRGNEPAMSQSVLHPTRYGT